MPKQQLYPESKRLVDATAEQILYVTRGATDGRVEPRVHQVRAALTAMVTDVSDTVDVTVRKACASSRIYLRDVDPEDRERVEPTLQSLVFQCLAQVIVQRHSSFLVDR